MNIDYSESSGYGSSDHTSFTAGGVPVLFFFSGLHGDYHKPSDTWDKIDAPDAAKVLAIVAEVTDESAQRAWPSAIRARGAAGPRRSGRPGIVVFGWRLWPIFRLGAGFRRRHEGREIRRRARRISRRQSGP